MLTSTILASAMFTFLGKMFACGFLGLFLLIALRLCVDVKMNPRGWKFGNELYDHKEDNFFSQGSADDNGMRLQRVRVEAKNPLPRKPNR